MAAGYHDAGKLAHKATFELTVRHLPNQPELCRGGGTAAGRRLPAEPVVRRQSEIDYLRGLPQFQQASPAFFDYLREFRFTGDLFAVPEGTPVFAGEPILTIRAPLIEAQIPETYLLSAITFQSLVATKAARMVDAGGGRRVVEFGTRRAHTPEAGVYAARAALYRRMRRHLEYAGGDALRHPGFRHRGPFLGDGLLRRDAGLPPIAAHPGRAYGAAHRHLRHARRRAQGRGAGPSAVGRAAG